MERLRSSRSGSMVTSYVLYMAVPAVLLLTFLALDFYKIVDVIKTGRYADLVLITLIFAAILFFLDRVDKGMPLPMIRSLAAIEAIREGVGRAVEMRKPVHWSFGSGGLTITGERTGETLANLAVLGYTAGLCAQLGARFIFHMPAIPAAIPLLEGIVLEAYAKEGKLDEFDRLRDLRYYGGGMMVYCAAMTASFMDEGVAMKIMMGPQPTCQYVTLEAAKIQGAIVIGGTARWTAMYSFVLTCDYLFIGEECYAAGAKVSGNPYMISSLASEEIGKIFTLALLFVGAVLMLIGVKFVDLMKN